MEQKVNWFRRVTDLFILNSIRSEYHLVMEIIIISIPGKVSLAEDAGQVKFDLKNL